MQQQYALVLLFAQSKEVYEAEVCVLDPATRWDDAEGVKRFALEALKNSSYWKDNWAGVAYQSDGQTSRNVMAGMYPGIEQIPPGTLLEAILSLKEGKFWEVKEFPVHIDSGDEGESGLWYLVGEACEKNGWILIRP